jgi:hypothetical protein
MYPKHRNWPDFVYRAIIKMPLIAPTVTNTKGATMLLAELPPPPEGGNWVISAAVEVALVVVVESVLSRPGMLSVLKGFSKLKLSRPVSLGSALSKLARLV